MTTRKEIRGMERGPCEFCTSQPGTYYGYDAKKEKRWGCAKHLDQLQQVCVTILFPRPRLFKFVEAA